jgi:hypothetical protein
MLPPYPAQKLLLQPALLLVLQLLLLPLLGL